MPMQSWEAHIGGPAPGVAGTALASSTTLTDISPAPQITMPANFLDYVGACCRLTSFGVFSTTGTPTLLLGFYYGGVAGTAIAATAASATGSGVTNVPFRLEYTFTVRSIGATGTIIGQGFALIGTAVTAVGTTPLPVTALATVTIDTTAAKAITTGAQWGTNSASNTITCHGHTVESVA